MKRFNRRRQKTTHRMGLGANVRSKRHQQNFTQSQLAELADLHPTYISSIENGERNVSIDTIMSIARALKCSPKDLIPE